MELHLSPDVQAKLAHSAAKQGRNADELVHEVLTQYLDDEARFAILTDDWSEEDRRLASDHIEKGFAQAERGELLDVVQARGEIETMKQNWRQQRPVR